MALIEQSTIRIRANQIIEVTEKRWQQKLIMGADVGRVDLWLQPNYSKGSRTMSKTLNQPGV